MNLSWQLIYAKMKEYTDEMNRQYINEKARRIIAEMSLKKIDNVLNDEKIGHIRTANEISKVLDEAQAQKIKLFTTTKIIQCEKYKGAK